MSTATVTPRRPATERAGSGRLLYAEWTKFVTVRGWVIAMVVSALLTAGRAVKCPRGRRSGSVARLPRRPDAEVPQPPRPDFHLILIGGYLGLGVIAVAVVWWLVRRTSLSAG